MGDQAREHMIMPKQKHRSEQVSIRCAWHNVIPPGFFTERDSSGKSGTGAKALVNILDPDSGKLGTYFLIGAAALRLRLVTN